MSDPIANLEARLHESEHQRALLAQALGEVLVASGSISAKASLSGPQLLQFAAELAEELSKRRAIGAPAMPESSFPMGEGWRVEVSRWGESVLCVAPGSLAGKQSMSEDDGRLIRGCAEHLLAFLGLPTTQCCECLESPLNGPYGDVLRPFVESMQAELHDNSHKGDRPGWLKMSRSAAVLEIYHHVGKLQIAVRDNDHPRIREYTADIANTAMMALDVCGGIEPRPAATPEHRATAVGG